MIESIHEHYFYYPNGSKKSYFRMKKPTSKKMIVQHPYFLFDPVNNQIYFEEYKLRYQGHDLINEFINLSESNANLKEDEYLWYYTGYWSIQDHNYLYIGSGDNEAIDTITNIQKGQLVFCLSSRDFIILLKSTISQRKIKRDSVIDIFCTNSFLPYAEVLKPFRSTLEMMGEIHLQRNQKLDYSSINVEPQHATFYNIRGYSFSFENKKNILIPHAAVPLKNNWLGPVIIPNDFGPFPLKSLDSLGYIFSRMVGGSLKGDFFTPGNFIYNCSIIVLNDVILLNGQFDRGISSNEIISDYKEDSKINKSFLDYFSM